MNAVFLDTVGLLAVWNRWDQWHAAADAALRRVIEDRRPLVTTRYVLLECGNAAARRGFRPAVDDLRQTLMSNDARIDPTPDEWETAWSAYRRGLWAEAGIVDHVSIVVMQRLGITDAFTNDRHFAAAGLVPLF